MARINYSYCPLSGHHYRMLLPLLVTCMTPEMQRNKSVTDLWNMSPINCKCQCSKKISSFILQMMVCLLHSSNSTDERQDWIWKGEEKKKVKKDAVHAMKNKVWNRMDPTNRLWVSLSPITILWDPVVSTESLTWILRYWQVAMFKWGECVWCVYPAYCLWCIKG